jgi:peptidyl-prolyl cis-trans isomerase C
MTSRLSKTRFALLALLLCLFSACKEKERGSSPILLRVDGRSVTVDQFKNDFEKTLPSARNLSTEEKEDLQRSFLVQVIDRELTLAVADRLGITISPAQVEAALQKYRKDYPPGVFEKALKERGITLAQWRCELEEGLLMEKVVRQAVYSRVTVSEKEIAAYYQEHRDEFDRPVQVRARQIVVANEAEGQRILGLLRQEKPFEEVARQYSLSPDREQGGDLGFFARGEMPSEFDAIVFALPVGRLSELVKSEYGYHVFKVEERREAERLTLEAVSDEIRQKLHAEKKERAYQKWLHYLHTQATIEVNWSLL